VGVDKSEEMVRFAAEAFPSPNLSFAIMDASSLSFDGEFDIVFSNATLHWVLDHRPVLSGIYRALKPGGRCLLQMAGRGNAARFFDAVLASGPVYDRWGHYFADLVFPYGFYAREEYAPWLLESGLTPVRVESFPRDMTQQGALGLAGWIRTTWLPYTQRIPEGQRDRFVAEAAEEYISRYPLDHQGLVHVPMVRLEVEAVKG
jgi:trans-aconitate 2-methyltransferase